MKKAPKHIKAKVERMSRLMEQLVDLNMEVEEWVESHTNVDDGFDFTYDFRDNRGYGIMGVDDFISAIETRMS